MKGIRARILKRFKSLQPFHSSIDHNSTYDHIQTPEKFSFQNHQNCKEECKTREEELDHAPDETEDLFQECDEEVYNENFNMAISLPIKELIGDYQHLSSFEQKSLPGGRNSVVLYTTSLRGIRKTFEDCESIKFLLDSFHIIYHERDVSMDLEFREGLWEILGGRVIPPRLFIKGRNIGGADEVVSLHERGELKYLLQGIPLVSSNQKCGRCNNLRFVLCCNCNGSRKVFDGEGREGSFSRCSSCNENGLIKCPLCF